MNYYIWLVAVSILDVATGHTQSPVATIQLQIVILYFPQTEFKYYNEK